MSNEMQRLACRRTLALGAGIALCLVIPRTSSAQFMSAMDLSSRASRLGANAWQNQVAISPFAQFDHSRFSIDGRWTAYGVEGQRIDGFGAASATYFSPAKAGLQFSLAGFADRTLLNETFAVSRFGADARLSYRMGHQGVWLGREVSRDNKSTPMSATPRASAGAWRQWGNTVVTLSMASFGGHQQTQSFGSRKIPNPIWVNAPPSARDTLSVPDSLTVTDSSTTSNRHNWNDAEVALHWGAGRFAFRGIVGTRLFTANQPNEFWAQAQGSYTIASDFALIAATGVHPSSVAYGVSRARFMQLGFRIAPTALLKPKLPTGVRPVAAAFEVRDAAEGRRTLRIRVPSARSVELSGDFTDWKPISLTRADGDRWEATLAIAPGMHRLAIRVNGDAWTPPPGLTSVPDEFQGTVGVIVVK